MTKPLRIGALEPSQVVAQAITWTRQAGQIAMRHFSNVSVEYKPDNTLLTQADTEIEQFLVEQVQTAYPGHGLLAEEGTRVQGVTFAPYTWVIDPLDGTTVFAQGLPGWGIAVALLYRARPVLGLFYMPLLDDLTYAVNGQVYHNGGRLGQTLRSEWGRKGFLAVSAGTHHDFDIDAPRTRAIGSVGASLVYTARGSASAAFIPKAYLWDLAAGATILNQVGGRLCYLSGRPVDYGPLFDGRLAPEPIIAGHPALLAELQSAIRPRNG